MKNIRLRAIPTKRPSFFRNIFCTLMVLFSVVNGVLYAQFQQPDIGTPSPNAASLGLYGKVPVSLFAGLPNISIPIYTAEEHGIQIPIDLSYHASGVRLNQQTSWVGLNWNLNAGGSISRTVKDVPDDMNMPISYGGFSGFYYNHSILDATNSEEQSFTQSLVNDSWKTDTEPDEFNFNFLGISGSFYLDHKGKWKVKSDQPLQVIEDNQSLPIPQELIESCEVNGQTGFEIIFTFGNSPTFKGFTIIDAKGYKYYFGGSSDAIEYSIPLVPRVNEQDSYDPGWLANSWQLKSVTSPEGHVLASFDYKTYDCNDGKYIANFSESWAASSYNGQSGDRFRGFLGLFFRNFGVQNCSGSSISEPPFGYYAGTLVRPTYLSKITTDKQIINFIASTNEEMKIPTRVFNLMLNNWNYYDLNEKILFPFLNLFGDVPYTTNEISLRALLDGLVWKKLDKIEVLNKSNVKTQDISLSYLYSDDFAKRLVLSSVNINNPTDQSCKNTYSLSYYNDYQLPEFYDHNLKTDHWGFFNNRSYNVNNIVSDMIGGDGLTNFVSAKEASDNIEILRSGSLKRITYPTGGYSEFSYEPHSIYKYKNVKSDGSFELLNSNDPVGGIRIQKIEDSDESISNERIFSYLKSDGTSSGISAGKHVYFSSNFKMGSCENSAYLSTSEFSIQNVLFGSINAIGSPIGYSQVKETLSDGSYTVYKYTNFESEDGGHPDISVASNLRLPGNDGTRYEPFIDMSDERGKLLAQEYYSSGGKLMQKRSIGYNRNYNDFVKATFVTSRSACAVGYLVCNGFPYKIFVSDFKPSYEELYSYDIDGEKYTLDRTDFTYNNIGLPSEVKTSRNNKFTKTKNKYVSDYDFQFSPSGQNLEQTESIKLMQSIGILSKQVEQQIWNNDGNDSENGSMVGGFLNFFRRYNAQSGYNNIQVEKTYRFKNGTPVTDVEMSKIDNQSNISQFSFDNRYSDLILDFGTDAANGYTIKGEPKRFTGSDGIVQNFSWGINEESGLLKSKTIGDQTTLFAYTNPLVGVSKITDPNGIETTYSYDGFNRLRTIKDFYGNLIQSFTYNLKSSSGCGDNPEIIPTVGPNSTDCDFDLNLSGTINATPNQQITLSPNCSGANCGDVTYSWMGNGASGIGLTFQAPSSTGTYVYTLKANKNGCTEKNVSIELNVQSNNQQPCDCGFTLTSISQNNGQSTGQFQFHSCSVAQVRWAIMSGTTELAFGIVNVTSNTVPFTVPSNVSSGSYTLKVDVVNCVGTATIAFNYTKPGDCSATGTGLRGKYFNNFDLSGNPVLTRIDPTINFMLGADSPSAPTVNADFSVRWEGQVEAPESGTYTFKTNNDDGTRLWVNNVLLIDDWNPHGPEVKTGTITLNACQKYDIKMEFFDSGGGAQAILSWSYPGQSEQTVPQNRLYPASGETCPTPTINQPSSTIVCAASNQTVTLTASGSVTWYKDGNQTGTGNSYVATQPGVYTAKTVNGTCTSQASNAITITEASNCNLPACDCGFTLTSISQNNGQSTGQFQFHSCSVAQVRWAIMSGTTELAFGIVNVTSNTVPFTVPSSVSSGSYTLKVDVINCVGTATIAFNYTKPGDCSATGTGLRGKYFNNFDLSGNPVLTRVDPTINFILGADSPASPTVSVDFSVRWEGQIEAPESGTYTFKTNNDDGTRLWVNNVLLIDDWNPHGPEVRTGTITLNACQKYDIKMEFFDSAGGAQAVLSWSYPGQSEQIVPQNRLYPASGETCPTPTINQPSSTIVCAASNQTVTLTASGSVTWYKDGNQTGTGNSYVATQPGVYTAKTVNGSCTSQASNAITITEASNCGSICYTLAPASFPTKLLSNQAGVTNIRNSDGSASQIWEVNDQGSGFYKFVARGSTNGTGIGNVLGVAGQGSSAGNAVELQSGSSGDHQLWVLSSMTGSDANFHKFVRKSTTLRLGSKYNWGAGDAAVEQGAYINIMESDLELADDPDNIFGKNKWVMTPVGCPTPICTPPSAPGLVASPNSINSGSSSMLSATGCENGTINWVNGGPLVYPTVTTTYKATCTKDGCTSEEGSVTVTVENNCSSLAGYFDFANCGTLSGWAWNSTQPNTPINVDVMEGNTVILANVPAANFRLDLQNAGIGNGVHGFQIETPSSLKNGQNRNISIRVSGCNYLLSNSPKTINCSSECPPLTISKTSGTTVCTANNTTVTLTASGCNGGTLSWYRDGSEVASGTSNLTTSNPGVYSAKCTSSCISTSESLNIVETIVLEASQVVDARISSAAVNANYGSLTELGLSAWTYSGALGVQRVLIDFEELKNIPQGASISSATLQLYGVSSTDALWSEGNYTNNNASWIQRITSSWQENTVNWNNQPSSTSANRVAIPQSTSKWDYNVSLSVQTIVQDIVNRPPSERNGFMLSLQNEQQYRSLLFSSKEAANPTKRPHIQVIYSICPVGN